MALRAVFAVRAYLIVWESNPARRFYERLGGRNTGKIDVENPSGGFDRYILFAWDQPKAMSSNVRSA